MNVDVFFRFDGVEPTDEQDLDTLRAEIEDLRERIERNDEQRKRHEEALRRLDAFRAVVVKRLELFGRYFEMILRTPLRRRAQQSGR